MIVAIVMSGLAQAGDSNVHSSAFQPDKVQDGLDFVPVR